MRKSDTYLYLSIQKSFIFANITLIYITFNLKKLKTKHYKMRKFY